MGERTARSSDGVPCVFDTYRVEPTHLAGVVVGETTQLQLPTALRVVGPYLVVIDDFSDSVLHVFRGVDGALVRSLGRRGKGPGEFAGAWQIDPVPGSGSEFWVYDLGLRRITHVDLRRVLAGEALAHERMINLTSPATVLGPVWLGDTVLVTPGLFAQGRLGYFDSDGRLLRTRGELPRGTGRFPASVVQSAYQAVLRPSPDRTRLALATRYAGKLDIYDAGGVFLRTAATPFQFEPRYSVAEGARGPVMATDVDVRLGYVDLATTDRYIFALFSGRLRECYKGEAPFGDVIHVFGWNGDLLRVLKLDASVLAIDVDTGTAALYAVRHDPQPAVMRYALGFLR